MKKIALIGSTGSIGKQTLNIVRRHPNQFQIVSLAGGENSELLCQQVKEFNPLVATAVHSFNTANKNTSWFFGENAFTNAIIDQADIVVIALVGFKGILAVLESIKKGKTIALANKESLVVGGQLVMESAKKAGVQILPIDSEHSAIWQALGLEITKPFNKIILTASGGAFRDLDIASLNQVTAKDALKHPNWNMGNKITIDCATMVNKAFEVIEAKWLFNTTFDNIDVIIHRESIIHSMVEYIDGSVLAQMSYPNMELPISLALSYPNRIVNDIKSLNFAKLKNLSFSEVDNQKYPCLDLVISAGRKGGVLPAVVNGANEMAVQLFLQNKIKFNDIYKALAYSLDCFKGESGSTFDELCQADLFGRQAVAKLFGE